MAAETKNLFVSHVHEDDALLADFKSMLTNAGVEIRDASINSTKPNQAESEAYIRYEILAPRIKWAGAMIVLITPNTHLSDWVNWEIEYAMQQGKRIVGVFAQGAKESDLPTSFEQYGDALVGWQSVGIIDAINGSNSGTWATSDGGDIASRDIPRFSCGG